MSIDQAAASQPTASVTVTAPAPIKAFSEGGDGPSFKDVIDILNPLQHIPVINTIYRHLTGDEEGAVADVGGGALWAGPIGLIGSIADLAVKAESGKTIGDNILSWLGMGDDDAPAEQTKVAESQAQQQVQRQAQQTAAATAPLTAIASQSLAPLSRQRDDRKDAARDGKDSGPVKAGDYLVFGAASAGAAGNQPISLTPSQSESGNSAPSRQGNYLVFGGGSQGQGQGQSNAQPQAQTASADATAIGRQGDYLVFGVSVPAMPATRPAQVAQAMAPVSATVTPQTPIQVPVQAAALQTASAQSPAVAAATPPGLSPLPSRNFSAPPRRTQVTPNSIGQPTTGPAAIPGHSPSQAIPMNQADQTWFAQAVSAGLDKYAAAQKLADQSATNSASTAAGAQASADAFATIH